MGKKTDFDTNILSTLTIEDLAKEVASLITQQLSAKDILRLSQLVFLNTEETAALFGVKPKTISTWISQDRIPVRYAGGKPVFLLSELLQWSLPENDKHSSHRLSMASSCNIALNRLATNRERSNPDVGL